MFYLYSLLGYQHTIYFLELYFAGHLSYCIYTGLTLLLPLQLFRLPEAGLDSQSAPAQHC